MIKKINKFDKSISYSTGILLIQKRSFCSTTLDLSDTVLDLSDIIKIKDLSDKTLGLSDIVKDLSDVSEAQEQIYLFLLETR